MHEREADRPRARLEDGEVRRASRREPVADAPHLEEIRRRMASGAYESPEVMRRVARRILDRNDL
jgi:hypothetical protein